VVAPVGLVGQQGQDILLSGDTLGEAAAHAGQAQATAGIKGQVSGGVGEGQQALDGREHPRPADRSKIIGSKGVSVALKIRECHLAEGLSDAGQEARDVGAVGTCGMLAPIVQPTREQCFLVAWKGHRQPGDRCRRCASL